MELHFPGVVYRPLSDPHHDLASRRFSTGVETIMLPSCENFLLWPARSLLNGGKRSPILKNGNIASKTTPSSQSLVKPIKDALIEQQRRSFMTMFFRRIKRGEQ